jgi:protein-arginine kinase
MSNVANLVLAGKAFSEVGVVIAGIVSNGTNYIADIKYLPQIFVAGKDAAAVLANLPAYLEEIKNMDDDGRQAVADSWRSDIPNLPDSTVDDTLREGAVLLTYGFEVLGFFLRTFKPS